MKLTCPSCETSYDVGATVPPGGRKVRCARCGHSWRSSETISDVLVAPEAVPLDPPGEAVAAVAPLPAPEPDTPPEPIAGRALEPLRRDDAELVAAEHVEDDMEPEHEAPRIPAAATPGSAAARAAARVRDHRATDRRPATRTLYGFIVGATVAMVALAVQYRQDIVRELPQTARIFGAVGLDVNTRGLRFEALAPKRAIEDGVPTLIVEGKILNLRQQETEVPALRFALRSADGDELYNWTIEPLQNTLDGAGELSFKTRLASPPAAADSVELRFVDRGPKRVGLNR